MLSALLPRELFPAQVDVNLAALELNNSDSFFFLKKKKQHLSLYHPESHGLWELWEKPTELFNWQCCYSSSG